jgi:hypothetical protein
MHLRLLFLRVRKIVEVSRANVTYFLYVMNEQWEPAKIFQRLCLHRTATQHEDRPIIPWDVLVFFFFDNMRCTCVKAKTYCALARHSSTWHARLEIVARIVAKQEIEEQAVLAWPGGTSGVKTHSQLLSNHAYDSAQTCQKIIIQMLIRLLC